MLSLNVLQIMAPDPTTIRVKFSTEEQPVQLTLHKNRLLLTTLQVRCAEARGLSYVDDGGETVLSLENGAIMPPADGWESKVFSVIVAKPSAAALSSQAPVVLAPERKIPTFEGREDTAGRSVPIDEFVETIRHAFDRYAVLPHQRGQFLLDSLKGGPRVEAKALLNGGKKAEEVLDYLKDSYGEGLTSGELQRRLLDRRQQPGESVRDFSVALQRLFLRLQKKDKTYQDPDRMLKEQFVDGLEGEGLRHSCRDLLDRCPTMTFTELKNWAIKRAEREGARDNRLPKQGAIASMTIEESPITQLEEKVDKLQRAIEVLALKSTPPQPYHGPIQSYWSGPPQPEHQYPMQAAPPNQPQFPLCYNCGGPGHFARNCPLPRLRQPGNQSQPYIRRQRPDATPLQENQRPQLSGAKQLEGSGMAQ